MAIEVARAGWVEFWSLIGRKNMGERGKKSAAALSVVSTAASLRPKPPDHLTPEQASEWRAIVARMPATWFTRETHGLLTAYCRHSSNARFVAEQIDQFRSAWLSEDSGLERFDMLSRLLEREQRAMSSLATRMRLTQGSRLKAEKAATEAARNVAGMRRPWE